MAGGQGYWVLAESGEVFDFGGAPALGGATAGVGCAGNRVVQCGDFVPSDVGRDLRAPALG